MLYIVFLPKLDDRRECRGRVDRLTKLTMNAVDYVRMIERMTRMMIKKAAPRRSAPPPL